MNTDTIQAPPPPPAQPLQIEPPRHAILFKLQIPALVAAGPALEFFRELLAQAVIRALCDKGILCKRLPAGQNAFGTGYAADVVSDLGPSIGLIRVTDLHAGLVTLRDTFASLHAVEYVEIGWCDFREGVWRGWHPKEAAEPFERNVDLISQWAAKWKRPPL